MKFPIDFTENGDKTSEAIAKIIKEFGAVYEAIDAKEPGTGGGVGGDLTEVGFKDIQGAVADNTALANALSAKQPTSTKDKPGGYLGIGQDGFADAAFLPPVVIPEPAKKKILRQLDLMVPGTFASAVGDTKLSDSDDFSYWLLEPGRIKSISARCKVADSGATPAKVKLVVNNVPVDTELSVLGSSLTTIETDIEILTGNRLEIAVTNTGTNKDSENLRLFVVAEVEV